MIDMDSGDPRQETPQTRRGDYFATTHWSIVATAGNAAGVLADEALETLCRNYWFPLYAYVRRQGHSKEDAEDLTQEFFERFLSKNYLAGLSADKGRFRAFLLAALKHFLANEWDRNHRQKRGGLIKPLSLEWQEADSQYQITAVDLVSPDKLYDRAWAMTLLARVLERLRAEHSTPDKLSQFETLKAYLTHGKGIIPYSQAAETLGMAEGAVRTAVHRLRAQYRRLLIQEISQTLLNPGQAEEELATLFQAFRPD
jgi:RNA polymerase sigma-70 factor (ECF subfamily)